MFWILSTTINFHIDPNDQDSPKDNG
jgi:hypothetical protein